MENPKMTDEMLLNYLRGTLSEEERQRVEAWYEESPENEAILDGLYDAYVLERAIVARDQVDVEASLKRCRETIQHHSMQRAFVQGRRRSWSVVKRVVAVAAVVVLVCMAGFYGANIVDRMQQPVIMRTGIGERVQVELPDGSKVWMNACSEIAYTRKVFSSERNLAIKGEAYFEVAKMKYAPFIVHCDELDIRVLGTKFNVRANVDDDLLTTTLVQGSIQVSSPMIREDVLMKPNQQFVFNKRTHKGELSMTNRAGVATNWTKGRFYFFKESFEEIAKSLERNYNISITFKDDEIRRKKFICEFDASDNIYRILSILQMTGKFDYNISGRHVEIQTRN